MIGLKKGRRAGWEVYQCQAPLLEGPERGEWRDGGRDWAFGGGTVGKIWRQLAGGWLNLEAGGIGGVLKGRSARVARSGLDRESSREAQSAARESRGLRLGDRDPSGLTPSLLAATMFNQQQPFQQLQQQQLQQQQLLQLQQLLQQSPPQAPLPMTVSR